MVGKKMPEAQRRRMILDAAAHIAFEEGLDNLTVRKVAAAAAISPGLVFHHFETKDGLLLGLLHDLLDRTLDAAELEEASGRPGEERLLALVSEEIAGLETQSANVELLFVYYFARRDDLFRDPIRLALRRYGSAFAPAARAASAADTDPDQLVQLVLSLLEGASVSAIVAPETFRPDQLVRVLEDVIRPRRPSEEGRPQPS